MPFDPPYTFQQLVTPGADAMGWTSALLMLLGSNGVTPGSLSVSLTVGGIGSVPIPAYGMTLFSGAWTLQSTNPAPITLSSSSPTGLLFRVIQQGAAGGIVAGTVLNGYPAIPLVTATALGSPTAPQGQGFPVANWPPNGTANGIVKAIASGFVAPGALIAALAGSASLGTAPGNPTPLIGQSSNQTWLDLVAYSQFGVQRVNPATGQYSVTLSTAASGKGPYTISPQGMWLVAGGKRYQSTNTAPVVVPAANSATFTFQAENPGGAYNAPIQTPATPLTQVTPLLGVVATSANYNGTGSSVVVAGVDAEQDPRMILRCQTQWATLTTSATYQTIINRALNYDSTITAVYVNDQNPDGPGTFRVYLASASGAYSGTAGFNTFLASYQPIQSTYQVFSAGAQTLNVTGNVYVPKASMAVVAGAGIASGTAVSASTGTLAAAFSAFQQGLQIGDGITTSCGLAIPAALQTGCVRVSDLYGLCIAAGGARAFLSAPSADTVPAKTNILVLNTSGLIITQV